MPTTKSVPHQIAAHHLHARYDSREITKPARRAFLDRFLLQADPDGALSEEERRRRADHLLKAHMLRLAQRSAEKRRAKAGAAQ